MTRGDLLVERAADRLEELSRTAARDGGLKAKLAEPLAEDAEFLRRMKPSLVAARVRGEAPTNGAPAPAAPPARDDAAPVRREASRTRPATASEAAGDGPNPLAVIGAAFVLGMLLAHAVAWLGHRYPRD
jgi:hypothetical protein